MRSGSIRIFIRTSIPKVTHADARSVSTVGLKKIGEFKNELVVPEMVPDERLARLYEGYNEQLRASNALDFDDLLLLTYRLFQERPKIASFYRRQYRYICIDEAQDLNEAQYRVLSALCGTDYTNVMMVGDPKQAIFMWNGAHPKYLDLFESDFSAKKIELQENFRSSKAVVDVAKKLNDEYSVDGTLPIQGSVEVVACENEEAEAEYVQDTIEHLVANGHQDLEGEVTLERCAIIGRNRFVFRAIQEKFTEEGTQFYKKLAGTAVQSESHVIAELELGLRLMANPLDRLHLGMFLKRCGVGKSADEVYGSASRSRMSGEELLQRIRDLGSHADAPVFQAMEAMEWLQKGFRSPERSFEDRKVN